MPCKVKYASYGDWEYAVYSKIPVAIRFEWTNKQENEKTKTKQKRRTKALKININQTTTNCH